MEGNLGFAGPPQKCFLEIFGQGAERGFETLMEVRGDAFEETLVIDNHPLAASPPRQDSALFERFVWIGDHQSFVENEFLAKAVANRTGTGGGVKGEMLGGWNFVALSGAGTVVAV